VTKPARLRAARRNPASRLAINYWSPDRLIPYERNARTHSDEQVAEIAAAIRRFGFTNPILVSPDNTIIAGHGRLLAARLLGMNNVPVIVAGGEWTDEERRAYILADNQLALKAGWNEELLRLELGELRDAGFDLMLTGFGASAIAELLDVREPITDPDEVPEPPSDPISRRGDLWVLGRHRLLCGDATNADDVRQALDGASPRLMVTDPPYGVNYDAGWRPKRKYADGTPLSTGVHALGRVENDDRADWREAWALFPGDVAYVWCASLTSDAVIESLEACDLTRRSLIIWNKNIHTIGRGDYHWKHETCWYVVRKNKPSKWAGDRRQNTVWDINKPLKSESGHSTQKPVECMRRPIENNSEPGDAVYEPFSGSGTTIIAAELSGRRCHAIELNPAYIDVAVQRWQQVTGERATLVATGRTFDETRDERRPVEA
jgi:DNA modification methylase